MTTTATATTTEQYAIDASGKRLGRVATEAAHVLMGKHRADAVRHIAASVTVTVTNASKLLIDERKRAQKEYERYSGHPGGRRVLSMAKMIEQKGYAELRAVRMKKLTISE
jgi:large subunit ribosomal protein L13